jgi:hypothetical protein
MSGVLGAFFTLWSLNLNLGTKKPESNNARMLKNILNLNKALLMEALMKFRKNVDIIKLF